MESTAADTSPATSTRGFKGVFSKARRGGKDNSSTTSINGTDNSSEANGIRSSVDSVRENGRAARQSSEDGTTTTKARKLSKLIPGRLRRKKNNQDGVDRPGEAEENDVEDGERGRSISQEPPMSTILKATANSPRLDRGVDRNEDGDSSLNTHNTDNDQPLGSPLSLQGHLDHTGSTSPLGQDSDVVDPLVSSQSNNSSIRPSSGPKSTTFPISNTEASESFDLAPRNVATINLQQSEQSLSAPEAVSSKSRRGISPGAKIRNVFTSGSRKMDRSPPNSPDILSTKSSGKGNITGGIFAAGEKRNSMSLQQGSRSSKAALAMPQPITTGTKSPSSSDRSVPSITVTPRTPPSAAFDAPLTTVTPPTPTDRQPDSARIHSPKSQSSSSVGTNPNIIKSASGNMISHRRVRSDSATHQPSRLSNATAVPLTPTIEESITPSNRTPLPPGGAGGFFSSVFSMAQNATSTLTSSLANTSSSRPKSLTLMVDEDSNREAETMSSTMEEGEESPVEAKKRLAIDTLGSGDLSLSHLGIASDTPMTGNAATSTFSTVADELSQRPKVAAPLRRDETTGRIDDASAARTTSASYSDRTANDKHFIPGADETTPGIAGEKTPPNGSVYEGDQGARRSGSVRSRVGAVTRRHRNSSSATGNTVGTMGTFNGVSQASLSNTVASASTPKLTGFAVASKKRNRDFHQLFRTVPEDDYLIEDYSCALQREIILAGRMYVSESHICFSSNILGWVTTLIISFDEIVSVEKENTAMVFPNAIAIQTLHARQTFRSLLSREATYELIIGIWKISHPSLKSSLNGVRLDFDGTGDKTEKVELIGSENPSDASEEEEEVYDEDEDEGEDEGLGSFVEAGELSHEGSEDNDSSYKTVTRKASAMGVAIGAAAGGVPASGDGKAGEKAAVVANVDFPGPTTHAPTECSDGDTHYDKVVKDDIIPAPLGKVYSMMFGPASGGFMTRWFVDEQKMIDLQMEDDKKGLSEENRSRSYSYIKPLYASIGPKQTKCLITETLDSIDLEKAVSVTVVTQTPDVPSGSVFSTKTKFCLTWAPGNATRLFVNCTIEWTGKSWLKGPIEKGANDGQATYATDLVRALKTGVSLARPRAGTNSSRVKVKGKRKRGDIETPRKPIFKSPANEPEKQQPIKTWGLFEPLHGPVGPLVDIIGSLVSANMVIGFLTFLLLITWLRVPSRSSRGGIGFPQMSTPERMAAYEEIWRREESSLWDWLEQRIGMESAAYPAAAPDSDHEALKRARRQREQSLKHRASKDKMTEENMSEREIDNAIRATEARLEVLKKTIKKRRDEARNEL